MKEIKRININLIKDKKKSYRYQHKQKEIEKLARSIKKSGLLQPIIVRRNDDGFEIVQGYKRYKACILNAYNEIDAIIVEKHEDIDDFELMEASDKTNLSVIEEALIFQRIMAKENITQNELAKRLNCTQSTIANKLRLLKLPEFIKEDLSKNIISERHARALLKVKEEDLEKIYQHIIDKKYTVKNTEQYIDRFYNRNLNKKAYVGNILIGVNTIKEAYQKCQSVGLDCSINEVEYKNEVKLIIRFKK